MSTEKQKEIEILFLEDVSVKDHEGKIEFSAKEGEKKTLVETSAMRWIRRGKAVEPSHAKEQEKLDSSKEKDEQATTKKRAAAAQKDKE